MNRLVKKTLRKIKRIMVGFFGSKTDELYWKFRHIFDKSWAKSYISDSSVNNSHRVFLINRISNFYPFNSILEFGCASGPNLYLLAKKFPNIKIYGIDISSNAIEEGKEYFENKNIKNVFLSAGRGVDVLKNFKDKSIDLIFTDAVLIYSGINKIEDVIKEISRVASKGIVFLELHHSLSSSVYKDNWIHNYQILLEKYINKEKIKINRIPKGIWEGNWADSGHIIEVRF